MQRHASSFQQEKVAAWRGEEAMKNTFEFSCFVMQGHTHKELAITYQLQICNTNKDKYKNLSFSAYYLCF